MTVFDLNLELFIDASLIIINVPTFDRDSFEHDVLYDVYVKMAKIVDFAANFYLRNNY